MASAKKTPAKPAAPAKAPAKADKAAPKAPAKAAAPAKAPAPPAPAPPQKAPAPTKAGPRQMTEGEMPLRLHKTSGFPQQLAQIEIVKEGHFFIARTVTESGQKEYKNTVFEDLLTEMLITLQEQLAD
ncbi:MAG: hypothetical protein QOD77_1365 [Thermoplasmata archaeon]|jgi:3-oxoacyl-ACP reductase-like protein|nr:hypothetical protein [Thermoplasmata archaeon]